MTVDQVHN